MQAVIYIHNLINRTLKPTCKTVSGATFTNFSIDSIITCSIRKVRFINYMLSSKVYNKIQTISNKCVLVAIGKL